MCVGSRIKSFRKSISLTQKELSKAIGIGQSALSEIEKGNNTPSFETLLQLLNQYSDISAHWLMTGKGDMLKSSETPAPEPVFEKAEVNTTTGKVTTIYDRMLQCPTVNVHLGGEIAAGLPAESFSDPDEEFRAVPNILLRERPEHYFLLRVQGESMEPMILNDDLVLIYRENDWNRVTGKVCAIRLNGEITLKEVQIEPESEVIFLHPYNHKFKTLVVHQDKYQDVFLVGVLEAVIRTY